MGFPWRTTECRARENLGQSPVVYLLVLPLISLIWESSDLGGNMWFLMWEGSDLGQTQSEYHLPAPRKEKKLPWVLTLCLSHPIMAPVITHLW